MKIEYLLGAIPTVLPMEILEMLDWMASICIA